MQLNKLFEFLIKSDLLVIIFYTPPIILFFMWLYYVVFTRKKVPRLSKAKKGLPIFEWPDVLFQEKVNVIAQRENTLPLPGHQHSLVMKCFIWGLIVCVAAASIVEPDFFINNGMNNFYPRPYRFSCFGFG